MYICVLTILLNGFRTFITTQVNTLSWQLKLWKFSFFLNFFLDDFLFLFPWSSSWASQVVLVIKKLPANAGDIRDVGSIPGSGRSSGGGHTTHSSILAWRISHGQRSLAGYSPTDWKESETTEATKHTHMAFLLACLASQSVSSATQSYPDLCHSMELHHTRLPCPSPPPRNLLKLMCIESVMPSNHLILCNPLLQPSIFLSIRAFSNELALHIRWPKY